MKSFLLGLVGFLTAISLHAVLPASISQSLPAIAAVPEKPAEATSSPRQLRPFAEVTANLERLPGLFPIYRSPDNTQVYLGVAPEQLNQNLLLVATLSSGIGQAGLYRGWPINDLMIQLRPVPDNRLHLVVPNIYFRDPEGTAAQQQLLRQSFSDSPLYALDIVSRDEESGLMLVDLKGLMLSQDPASLQQQFPWILGNYSVNPDTSYLGELQAFPENVEIETVIGFSGGEGSALGSLMGLGPASVPDARAFSLRVRYSLSQLPQHSSYVPRPADERVGYFLSAYRPPTSDERSFVRYIHRWHLQPQEPTAELSEPVEPIVFWLENTVPPEYRQALREGVLMWNQAFEQAGFLNAIEVRQMPDDAPWDPADVRYNVIRWSDSYGSSVIGLGPSRVNPLTGEILDADVILDANVLRLLRSQFDTLVAPTQAVQRHLQLCSHPFQSLYEQWLAGERPQPQRPEIGVHTGDASQCMGALGQQHLAFGALAVASLQANPAEATVDYAQQYLRALTAHEVGHVLGLRHNFLGSTLLSPEQLQQPQVSRQQGLVSSVMDYFPPNIAPPGQSQGDYFPTRVGPYDAWAIEYGYRPLTSPVAALRQRQLNAIARRSQAPELAYATDEDVFDFIDPIAGAWDLSSDPLAYSRGQMDNARLLWEQMDWYSLRPDQGYGQLRTYFDLVLRYYERQAYLAVDYIGGQRFIRTHPWDSRGQQPFQPISLDQQRQALALLDEYVFSAKALEFSPQLVNSLAPERWNHWGRRPQAYPLDYPIYGRISEIQSLILSDLLWSQRLQRLRDGALRSSGEQLTLEELFDQLHHIVWREVLEEPTGDSGDSIDPLRRGLQRHHLTLLSNLVLRGTAGIDSAQSFEEFIGAVVTLGAPEDARVLSRYHLRQLQDAIATTLRRSQFDTATQAHLEDLYDRIDKVLSAQIQGY